MPRIKRIARGGIAYHVMNRANGRLRIFKKPLDFIAFENILAEGIARSGMRLCGYCIMSNHWHMLLWPDADDTLQNFMHWVTLTHTQRWQHAHGAVGIGHLYQSRYKSFPVQSNSHYLKTLRYIEANPTRAGIVDSASDWQWSSFAHRGDSAKPFELAPGPVPLSKNWPKLVDEAINETDSAKLANCIKRGSPFGQKEWTAKTAVELNLQSTLRKKGRPKKTPKTPNSTG